MATIQVGDEAVTVHLRGWERWAVRRATVTVPHGALSEVSVTDDWVSESFGLRHGGLVVSGLIKVGIWIGLDGSRRLLVLRRGVPTLRLGCDPSGTGGFNELLVSAPGARAAALRLAELARR